MDILGLIPPLDLAGPAEAATADMAAGGSAFFDALQQAGDNVHYEMVGLLEALPPELFLLAMAALAFFTGRKKYGFLAFVIFGLWLIDNQDMWNPFMETLALVLSAGAVSAAAGIPLGIVMAKSKTASAVMAPVLDFMQTMPAFVYLIPAVAFFGIGVVPGIFASVMFALPPVVRMTALGIRQVPEELEEAADAYGSTPWQKLLKLELPLAMPSIMAGLNQTVMMALSMVVIASMIGAPGLGRDVLAALQRAQVGQGFVAGLGIVIMAIMVDRFTQRLGKGGSRR